MDEQKILLGSMILYKNLTAFTSRVQQFWWTIMYRRLPKIFRMYSHLSVFKGKDECGRNIEAEANLQIDQTTFRFNHNTMDIYMPLCGDKASIYAINKALDQFEEKLYGFGSWLAIFLRGILELMFPKKNVRHWRILMDKTAMCSEFGWWVKYYMAEYVTEHSGSAQKRIQWSLFRAGLLRYNPNTYTPVDAGELFREFTNCWAKYGS